MSIKVLIIAYNPIPQILQQLEGKKNTHNSGWIQSTVEMILKHDEIKLNMVFPYGLETEGISDRIKYYTISKCAEIRFYDRKGYAQRDYKRFKYICDEVCPDIIQIYGTESIFLRQFVDMCHDMGVIDKCVVWVQGIVSRCAENFCLGYTAKEINRTNLQEFIKRTNIKNIRHRLYLNGLGETRILNMIKHAFVRTDWDQACCKAINPNLNFHFCSETLRPEFYEDIVWDRKNVIPYSLFFAQSNTPLKGMLQLIKAIEIVIQTFPNITVYTTGMDIVKAYKKWNSKIKLSSYQRIMAEKIIERKLENNFRFLGQLSSTEMRNQFIQSHVFVSASSIENSPNSLCEAMMLGVPVIASDVGGTGSLLSHRKEGMLYPFTEHMLLADYIIQLMENDSLALQLSENARARAKRIHDKEDAYFNLVRAYKKILKIESTIL